MSAEEREARVAKILGAWREACQEGERVEPDRIIEQHPDVAEELRASFAALDVMDALIQERKAASGAMPRIGNYRIIREIGRGGMGVVYEAAQEALDRRVALKVLSPAISDLPQGVKRFQREAKAAAGLHHTNIVPVYDMGREGRQWYYAMELVEGAPLSDVIQGMREPATRDAARSSIASSTPAGKSSEVGDRLYFMRVAEMFAGVADALECAHQEDVVHRDIKPANLLLDRDGVLKVVDFGLAQVLTDGPSLTLTGNLLGTPSYMSPEQAMAKRMGIDYRTDIYSLGATLYEVLTLQKPFDGENLQQVCSQIITKDPVLPRRTNARIPKDLETICLKAMEKDPDRRYQSARALARDLRSVVSGEAIRARPIGPVGRSWRKVKRHKVRSALAAAVIVLGVAGIVLGVQASRSAANEVARRYLALCDEGHRLLIAYGEPAPGHGRIPADELSAAQSFARAIELDPDRFEGYLGRALISKQRPDGRLADLEAARRNGLPPRSYHLLRAEVFRIDQRSRDMEHEKKLAAALPRVGGLDLLIEGRLAAHSGRYVDAEALFAQSIDETRAAGWVHTLARRSRAVVRFRLRDLDGALDDLLVVRSSGDDSAYTRVEITALWRHLGRDAKASREWDELLERLRAEGTELDWQMLFSAVRDCRMGKLELQADKFVELSAEAATRFPMSHSLALGHSFALVRAQRGTEALEEADRARDLAPDGWLHLHVRAHALRSLGRLPESVKAYEEAYKQGGRESVLAGLATALMQMGKLPEAREILQASLRRDPYREWSHLRLSRVCLLLGDLEASRAAIERALELNPTNGTAILDRARALRAQGAPVDMLAVVERALQVAPYDVEVLCLVGGELSTAKQYDRARAVLERARTLAPRHADVRRNLATVMLLLGHAKDSRREAQRATELGDDWVSYLILGHACETLKQFAEARAAYENAKRLMLNVSPHRAEHPVEQQRRSSLSMSLARVKRRLAFEERIPAIRKGTYETSDWREALGLAEVALVVEKDAAAALYLYRSAFRTNPSIVENPRNGQRYNGACAAALAGKASDAQALEWLRADLDAWESRLETESDVVAQMLEHWKRDPDLASIRDVDDLAKDLQKLWTDVDALLGRARGDKR